MILFPVNMDKIYVDQGGSRVFFADRCISTFYTPFGIKQLDSEFSKRIMDLRNDPEKIKNSKILLKEIKENPHLHRKIKRDLIVNLKNQL